MLNLLLSVIRGEDVANTLAVLAGMGLALIFGITVHEFSHAYVADRLGDMTPRYQHRVTLNPAAHIEPIGLLVFFLVGFGWGRPVQFNPYGTRVAPRTAAALVSIAGPISNIILGTLVGLSLRSFLALASDASLTQPWVQFVVEMVAVFVYFNFTLAVFNLIPIPPLDGSKILPALLPPDMGQSLERIYGQLGPYSIFLLFALLWFGGSFFNTLIYGPVQAMFRLVVGVPLSF